jgi:hypothetical protein
MLIVSHAEPRATLLRREQDGSWSVRDAGPAEWIELASVGGRLSIDELHRDGLEDAPRTP